MRIWVQSSRAGSYTNSFGYDAAGNPTTFKGASRTYNTKNQRTSGTSFVYDGNGNPTTYNGTSITFDPENKATVFGTQMTAGYTIEGLRAWKQNTATGAKTYFLYDGMTPVVELDATGTVSATNTVGANGLISRNTSAGTVYYTFDERGTTAQRLDGSGTVLSSHMADAFGTMAFTSITTDPYDGYGAQFGYYSDHETGLVLCTYRYYDPSTGRWLNRDPIGYDGGMNLYAYVTNNPINGFDPLGLDSLWYDRLAGWASNAGESIKSSISDAYSDKGSFGIGISTLLTSGTDFLTGTLTFPGAVGHLGEGSGNYSGNPKADPYGLGIWNDVGTASSVLLAAISATPSGKVAICGRPNRPITVSRWGRPGLKSGDWVMKGPPNRWNYLRSFKWDTLSPTNKSTAFSMGESFTVPANTVKWPVKLFGVDGRWKGLFGQRVYKP